VVVVGAREILNEIKWGGKEKISEAKITIIHRGAPEDKREIEGKDIVEIGPGFLKVMTPRGEDYIPYHRITKIEVGGKIKYVKAGPRK
jgi:uncharacterized protein (UPF0248 family)